jgi:spore coat protein H
MIDTYKPIAQKYSYRMPDLMYIRVNEEFFNAICDELPYEIERNYALYLESLEKPMPFFLNPLKVTQQEKLGFSWDTAYDFDAESITYTFELGKDFLFEKPIQKVSDLEVPVIETEMLPPGQYFYRVTAKNSSGYKQTAFDYYVDTNFIKHFGTMCFYVLEDGEVVEKRGEIK